MEPSRTGRREASTPLRTPRRRASADPITRSPLLPECPLCKRAFNATEAQAFAKRISEDDTLTTTAPRAPVAAARPFASPAPPFPPLHTPRCEEGHVVPPDGLPFRRARTPAPPRPRAAVARRVGWLSPEKVALAFPCSEVVGNILRNSSARSQTESSLILQEYVTAIYADRPKVRPPRLKRIIKAILFGIGTFLDTATS